MTLTGLLKLREIGRGRDELLALLLRRKRVSLSLVLVVKIGVGRGYDAPVMLPLLSCSRIPASFTLVRTTGGNLLGNSLGIRFNSLDSEDTMGDPIPIAIEESDCDMPELVLRKVYSVLNFCMQISRTLSL